MQKDTEKIKKLNFALEMHSRTKSYDFTKGKEIKECFKMSLGAYMAYYRYWNKLVGIKDMFDESIEIYDPVTWMNQSDGLSGGDMLVKLSMRNIKETVESFHRLLDREENVCKALLVRILNMDESIQKEVLGDSYVYSCDFIVSIFDNIQDIDYEGNTEDIYDSFRTYIRMVYRGIKRC